MKANSLAGIMATLFALACAPVAQALNPKEKSEPPAKQFMVTGITATPTELPGPGPAGLTVKIIGDGDPTAKCAGTLSVANKTTNAVLHSVPIQAGGIQTSTNLNVNFAAPGEYHVRLTMPPGGKCQGSIKTVNISVNAAAGKITKLDSAKPSYYDNPQGVMTFTLHQQQSGKCGKAQFWIEDQQGKKLPAFNQTLTNVQTPYAIKVSGFLAPPPAVPAGVPAIGVPPGEYKAVVEGDSADCNGKVHDWIQKKQASEVVLLGTFSKLGQVQTKNSLDTSFIGAGDGVLATTAHKYGDGGCDATFCVYHKGHPTLGIIETGVSSLVKTTFDIVKCEIEPNHGADLVIGIINQKASMPVITHCGLGSVDGKVAVKTVIKGVGSWATYKLKVYVKVPALGYAPG